MKYGISISDAMDLAEEVAKDLGLDFGRMEIPDDHYNGWACDCWFEKRIGPVTYIFGGSGYYGGLGVHPRED